MATRRVEIGPTGDTVRRNIARIRQDQRLTLRQLADRLGETDRPMSYTTLSQIENGARRVDVDDLMILSVALNVSPIVLLTDKTHSGAETVTATGLGEIEVRDLWDWLRAERFPITKRLAESPAANPDADLGWIFGRPNWVNGITDQTQIDEIRNLSRQLQQIVRRFDGDD